MVGRRGVLQGLVVLALSSVWACGGEEIDRRDELGLEAEKETYEVVPVGQEQETLGDSAAAATPSPAKIPAVKVQPDQIAAVAFDPEGEYTVQIAGYSDSKKATEMVRRLGAEGYPAYAIPGPEKKNVRVRIGYFKTRQEAQVFGQRFKEDKKMDFWIDRRANEKF